MYAQDYRDPVAESTSATTSTPAAPAAAAMPPPAMLEDGLLPALTSFYSTPPASSPARSLDWDYLDLGVAEDESCVTLPDTHPLQILAPGGLETTAGTDVPDLLFPAIDLPGAPPPPPPPPPPPAAFPTATATAYDDCLSSFATSLNGVQTSGSPDAAVAAAVAAASTTAPAAASAAALAAAVTPPLIAQEASMVPIPPLPMYEDRSSTHQRVCLPHPAQSQLQQYPHNHHSHLPPQQDTRVSTVPASLLSPMSMTSAVDALSPRPVHSSEPPAGAALPSCQQSCRSTDSARASQPPAPGAKASLVKQRRRYNQPRSSKYCHLCARHERAVKMVSCGNLYRGLCQKSVCRKCFSAYSLDWDAAVEDAAAAAAGARPTWLCPHCIGNCPKRAKCFAYDRQTVRRRVKTQEARSIALHSPPEAAAAPRH